ncbi:MAG: rhomboid family intramembrane serine protease [Chitinophagaceae bacterium]
MFTITLTIIILTCLVSIAAFSNQKIQEDLIFWPAAMNRNGQYYRFLTYGFIHADYMHLAFNMLSLWSLGQALEKTNPRLGNISYETLFEDKARLYYALLYLLAIIICTLPDYFKNRTNYSYRALGASGAVSAVIFSAIVLEPKMGLGLFFIPIPIPGYIFGLLFLIVSTYLARKGGDNIGHGAHVTGAVFGLIFTIVAAKLASNYDVMGEFVRALQR